MFLTHETAIEKKVFLLHICSKITAKLFWKYVHLPNIHYIRFEGHKAIVQCRCKMCHEGIPYNLYWCFLVWWRNTNSNPTVAKKPDPVPTFDENPESGSDLREEKNRIRIRSPLKKCGSGSDLKKKDLTRFWETDPDPTISWMACFELLLRSLKIYGWFRIQLDQLFIL